MSFVIMTVGKTHSGKTTFGKKLAQKIKASCLLDSDEISDFLKDKHLNLYNINYAINSHEAVPGYYLKSAILLEIYKHALKTKLPIISTSANSTKKIRVKFRVLAKKAGRQFIMVYFNLPERVLLERIKTDKRSTGCLVHSNSFSDLLINKQSRQFEVPSKKEANYYFEITDDISAKAVFKKVLELVRD